MSSDGGVTPILCHVCHHSIDGHEWDGGDDLGYKCEGGAKPCPCTLAPSDIARALLTAEPTKEQPCFSI